MKISHLIDIRSLLFIRWSYHLFLSDFFIIFSTLYIYVLFDKVSEFELWPRHLRLMDILLAEIVSFPAT